MTTRMYPIWKEVADTIANSSIEFYTIKELEYMLEEDSKTNQFNIVLMKMCERLDKEYQIYLILQKNSNLEKGYKIANDIERLEIITKNQQEKGKRVFRRQKRILASVNTDNLDTIQKDKLDRCNIRSGVQLAFLHHLRINKCLPSMERTVDIPKMLSVDSKQ